jgi:hypothetical protein
MIKFLINLILFSALIGKSEVYFPIALSSEAPHLTRMQVVHFNRGVYDLPIIAHPVTPFTTRVMAFQPPWLGTGVSSIRIVFLIFL